jgi:hypothetical protein
MEGIAREFLYEFDKSSELNIKAHLLKKYSEDRQGTFISKLVSNGIFVRFVDEAWKNYEAARESLIDLLKSWNKESIPSEVIIDVDPHRLKPYLEDACLSFEKFDLYEKARYDLEDFVIEDEFFARRITMNYRPILFDVVAMNP